MKGALFCSVPDTEISDKPLFSKMDSAKKGIRHLKKLNRSGGFQVFRAVRQHCAELLPERADAGARQLGSPTQAQGSFVVSRVWGCA